MFRNLDGFESRKGVSSSHRARGGKSLKSGCREELLVVVLYIAVNQNPNNVKSQLSVQSISDKRFRSNFSFFFKKRSIFFADDAFTLTFGESV